LVMPPQPGSELSDDLHISVSIQISIYIMKHFRSTVMPDWLASNGRVTHLPARLDTLDKVGIDHFELLRATRADASADEARSTSF